MTYLHTARGNSISVGMSVDMEIDLRDFERIRCYCVINLILKKRALRRPEDRFMEFKKQIAHSRKLYIHKSNTFGACGFREKIRL